MSANLEVTTPKPATTSSSGKVPPAEQKVTIKLDRPVSELTWIQKSLLFAELSRLAYADPEDVETTVYQTGFDQCVFIARDGAEAYVFGNRFDCMIVCRGTEPNQWNDIKADANAWTVAFDVGRVHSGFHTEVNELWPLLEQQIKENQRPMWFSGHSLGGAMAAVCAVRCKISPIPSNPQAIFSYGAPRVGDRTYTSFLKVKHYRWVNNNDFVTRMPPEFLGYRHKGQEIYLNAYGQIRRLTRWQRVKDRWRGFLRGLRKGEFDHFADHAISRYVGHIRSAVDDEENPLLRLRLPAFDRAAIASPRRAAA